MSDCRDYRDFIDSIKGEEITFTAIFEVEEPLPTTLREENMLIYKEPDQNAFAQVFNSFPEKIRKRLKKIASEKYNHNYSYAMVNCLNNYFNMCDILDKEA